MNDIYLVILIIMFVILVVKIFSDYRNALYEKAFNRGKRVGYEQGKAVGVIRGRNEVTNFMSKVDRLGDEDGKEG